MLVESKSGRSELNNAQMLTLESRFFKRSEIGNLHQGLKAHLNTDGRRYNVPSVWNSFMQKRMKADMVVVEQGEWNPGRERGRNGKMGEGGQGQGREEEGDLI